MNTIFQKGDTVYHYRRGKGFISSIGNDEVLVYHDSEGTVRYYNTGIELLSFTPYDLINGGFSQERPKPEIEKGTVIYVKSKKRNVWQLGYFERFEDGDVIVNFDKNFVGISSGFTYDEYSLENPLK